MQNILKLDPSEALTLSLSGCIPGNPELGGLTDIEIAGLRKYCPKCFAHNTLVVNKDTNFCGPSRNPWAYRCRSCGDGCTRPKILRPKGPSITASRVSVNRSSDNILLLMYVSSVSNAIQELPIVSKSWAELAYIDGENAKKQQLVDTIKTALFEHLESKKITMLGSWTDVPRLNRLLPFVIVSYVNYCKHGSHKYKKADYARFIGRNRSAFNKGTWSSVLEHTNDFLLSQDQLCLEATGRALSSCRHGRGHK